jgi:methionyl aminopeptidase
MKAYEAISIILKEMAAMAKPGVKTIDINNYAEKRIVELGCTSANKGYKPEWAKKPYEWATCINVNSIIAHGKPGDYELRNGDIASFDLGIIKDGECADAALSVGIGEISNARRRLLYYAKQTIYEVLHLFTPGRETTDIARAIEYQVLSRGFMVNRRFAGHRIGKEMHMKPNIYNTLDDQQPHHGKLEAGQIYCIEPMITNGKDNLGLFIDSDGWVCVTADGKDSAFYEHMILVTENGPKILTDHFTYKRGEG